MIIDFINGNGGGGGTTDTTMRASGFTGADFSNNILSFNNLNGTEVDSVNLSGLTPDLSDYYTKEEIDAGTSGITEAVSVLAVASQQHTEAIGGLQTAVSANTAAIAELSGSTGGDATELQPLNAIPESGAAGTVIAVNKPDEAGWGTYIQQSEVKSRTDITYQVEPSENPNPDLSLYPNTFQFDVCVPDSKSDGNYSWNTYCTIEGSVDYQNNVTFTNLGNFSQDGDKYVWNVDWYDYDTSEQVYKTLVMEVVVENGHPYICFNLTDGDCPYDIWNGSIYRTYWQDFGNWEYDTETGEATAWTESWSEMSDYSYPQSWNIVSPAHIGIYQANSANTYQEVGKIAATALTANQAVKLYNQPNADYNYGDLVVSDYNGSLRVYLKTGGGDLDGDRETLAWQGDVDNLAYQFRNLKIDTVYSHSATPVSIEEGAVFGVNNSGETSVKQAIGASGYTYLPMSWGDTGFYGVKQTAGNGFGIVYSIGDGTNGIMLNLWYNTDDISNPYWDYSSLQNDGWVVSETDNLTFTATDGNGWGFGLSGYTDGSYVYCDFSVPAVEFYGGMAEWKRVEQTVYQNLVASTDVMKIKKMTAADYALITPDANTLYIIL